MRCSPQKKTFVWLTKTYPKEEKFNKLNWLPLFYREQTLTRKKSCQESCPTGKKNATLAKEKNFGSGIGMTRPKQAGWREERRNSGGRRDLETLLYTLLNLFLRYWPWAVVFDCSSVQGCSSIFAAHNDTKQQADFLKTYFLSVWGVNTLFSKQLIRRSWIM